MRLLTVGTSLAMAGAGALLSLAAEPAPTLRAADLAPAALLSGPRFKVAEAARSDGYMTAFTVVSDFGTFEAPSREMLEVRVHEVAALEKLEDVSKTDVFAKSLAASTEKKAKAVANVATHPVETVKGVPKGVGRFFKGVGAKTKDAAGDAKDAVAGDESSSGGGKKAEDEAADAAKDASGMSKARRQWAQKLGVDPYTTNPALSKKLDDIGWAAYAGGFTTSLVSVPGVGAATTMNKMAWELPAADVAKHNDQKMVAMGVPEPARKAFLKNPHFTPTLQTETVEAFASLGKASGRGDAIALAARESTSEEDARFFRTSARLLARYHATVEPVASVQARRQVFVGRTGSGKVVFPTAFDYLTWTAEVEEAVAQPDLASAKPTLWLSGVASDTARRELAARGWTLKEKALPN
ncbi:MAG TPA: hypothetical protein VII13_18570 [Vicinamibacteria bacterium]|jgi:hypothetical protein